MTLEEMQIQTTFTVARMAAILEAGDRASGQFFESDGDGGNAGRKEPEYYAKRAWALYHATDDALAVDAPRDGEGNPK